MCVHKSSKLIRYVSYLMHGIPRIWPAYLVLMAVYARGTFLGLQRVKFFLQIRYNELSACRMPLWNSDTSLDGMSSVHNACFWRSCAVVIFSSVINNTNLTVVWIREARKGQTPFDIRPLSFLLRQVFRKFAVFTNDLVAPEIFLAIVIWHMMTSMNYVEIFKLLLFL